LIEDMKTLCEKMLNNSAHTEESIKDTPFGRVKEIIGIEGNAEMQLMIKE